MSLTLDEIIEHEERLRREIVERECLLAAFKVLHGYAANGRVRSQWNWVPLSRHCFPQQPHLTLQERTAQLPSPAPAALPAQAPVTPYMHPELRAHGSQFGNNGRIVWWWIQPMTDDYSFRDIAAA